MQIFTFLAFVLSVAFLGVVSATPTVNDAVTARSADGLVALNRRSGCDSSGPLGTGHFEWFIVVSCSPGASMTCAVMDASGCEPGVVDKIGSVEVDDPNDTTQFAKASNTNSVVFTCPSGGQIRCQANFEDNDDGPGYSLRVTQN